MRSRLWYKLTYHDTRKCKCRLILMLRYKQCLHYRTNRYRAEQTTLNASQNKQQTRRVLAKYAAAVLGITPLRHLNARWTGLNSHLLQAFSYSHPQLAHIGTTRKHVRRLTRAALMLPYRSSLCPPCAAARLRDGGSVMVGYADEPPPLLPPAASSTWSREKSGSASFEGSGLRLMVVCRACCWVTSVVVFVRVLCHPSYIYAKKRKVQALRVFFSKISILVFTV